MPEVRPLFLSTYPPEECGLATFAKDSADAVDLAADRCVSSIAAIQKIRPLSGDDARIVHVIDNNRSDAYTLAADVANRGQFDVISLQHEFGLYPGDWGRRIMDFVSHCEKPIVTTFHTLSTQPPELPRRLVREIAARSSNVIVMTETAARMLADVYGISGSGVEVIPHGVPVVPFERNRSHRRALGLTNRQVICTFGLINPGKGLEHMIRAMPRIVGTCPDALYLIVGVTHPQVKRENGEAYRNGLIALAHSLGVGSNVRFINEYLSLPELIAHLQSCDVFVTPYPGKEQIASGTMAYAMAAVGAIVSTPYLYAEEVLGDERGLLVPFGDSAALCDATLRFLTDTTFRQSTRRRAYDFAQPMFWPNVGRKYLDLFTRVAGDARGSGTHDMHKHLAGTGESHRVELFRRGI